MTKVKVILSKTQLSPDNGCYQAPLDKETFEKIKKAEEEKLAKRIPRKSSEEKGDRRGRGMSRG